MSDWKIEPRDPFHWITRREYIAIVAMQGMLAANDLQDHLIPEAAYKMADAMIKQAEEVE